MEQIRPVNRIDVMTTLEAQTPLLTQAANDTSLLPGAFYRWAYGNGSRPLLVLGSCELADKLAFDLAESGWRLLQADTLEDASALCHQQDILAGLAVLPDPLTDSAFQRVRLAVEQLADLHWVAILPREALARADVRRFVVGELHDYQAHPADPLRLGFALDGAWGLAALTQADAGERRAPSGGRFGMIGTSLPMRRLYAAIERVAETDLPVLITGETGTGKELVARAIHAQSRRAAAPFVALNCAALPASLVHSELFGVVKGAFTGASSANPGLIRTAHGGTLLLDEIGEMPLEAQASLLRFLDDKVVMPLGGRKGFTVDVTVIASTNRDLHQEAREGRFRQDLLYRLDTLSIRTPPLRDRPSDIHSLAEHFRQTEADALPQRLRGFTDHALAWLHARTWPGNVRQLRNCVIQAGVQCDADQITYNDLSRVGSAHDAPEQSLDQAVNGAERGTLEQLLTRNRGNVSKTARELKVSRMTVYRLMAKHDIARD